MTAKMRFTKAEILGAFAREDKSYRLGLLCTHWIRDIERYTPKAAELAGNLQMEANGKWISDADLVALLEDPAERELLSSDFLLTYLHTLIRAPFELLTDYCEDFDETWPGRALQNQMKSVPWYAVAYIVRNAVSHNFHIELGKYKASAPVVWRSIALTDAMEGHRPQRRTPLNFQKLKQRRLSRS
jgi:hypothetical protein